MLVATSVVTDSRVLREATSLVRAGHEVHIIGRSVPANFVAGDGITVSNIGTSSVLRPSGDHHPKVSRGRIWRIARWAMLPTHRASVFKRWAIEAIADGKQRQYDLVHAHDFTALAPAVELAMFRDVPMIYDSHEYWAGLPREYRPTPIGNWRDRRREFRWGSQAAAVITVGQGVADALHDRYGWSNVTVVRNTFPVDRGSWRSPLDRPSGIVYAGRIAAYRELDVIADASDQLPIPVEIVGPTDDTWVARFNPGRATVFPAESIASVGERIQRVGLAAVTHSSRWPSHVLALPNKLFHAVSLGVPVVATDVGELARIVRSLGLGTLYQPGDVRGFVAAVNEAMGAYPDLVANVREVADQVDWSTDERELLAVYEELS